MQVTFYPSYATEYSKKLLLYLRKKKASMKLLIVLDDNKFSLHASSDLADAILYYSSASYGPRPIKALSCMNDTHTRTHIRGALRGWVAQWARGRI